MKRILLIGATLVALGSAVNAATPKTETKSDAKATTEVVAAPSETKTSDAVGWFIYNGPQTGDPDDLDDPANYGTTQVDPSSVCSSGTLRCAAQFNLNGSGHATGTPIDSRNKTN